MENPFTVIINHPQYHHKWDLFSTTPKWSVYGIGFNLWTDQPGRAMQGPAVSWTRPLLLRASPRTLAYHSVMPQNRWPGQSGGGWAADQAADPIKTLRFPVEQALVVLKLRSRHNGSASSDYSFPAQWCLKGLRMVKQQLWSRGLMQTIVQQTKWWYFQHIENFTDRNNLIW